MLHYVIKKAFLVITAFINICASVIILINEIYPLFKTLKYLDHKVIFIGAVVLKGYCLVPFLTFEYYLLLFEQIFIDSQHYAEAIRAQSKLFSDSPKNSPNYSKRHFKDIENESDREIP